MNVFRDPAQNQFIKVVQEQRGGLQLGIRAVGNSGQKMPSWRLRTPGDIESLYPAWVQTKPRTAVQS